MLCCIALSTASVVSAAMTAPSEKPPVPLGSPAPPSPSPRPPSCLSGEYPLGSVGRSMLTASEPDLALPYMAAQWATPSCLNKVVTTSKVTDGLGFSPVVVHSAVGAAPEPHLAMLPA